MFTGTPLLFITAKPLISELQLCSYTLEIAHLCTQNSIDWLGKYRAWSIPQKRFLMGKDPLISYQCFRKHIGTQAKLIVSVDI